MPEEKKEGKTLKFSSVDSRIVIKERPPVAKEVGTD